MITQDQLINLFEYRDGGLYWKISTAKRVSVGDRFGAFNKRDGYRTGAVLGKPYREHRLIYLYHYGSVPPVLDHVNRKRDDNRIENLRPATRAQNSRNRTTNRNNTSGHPGVSFYQRLGQWRVQLNVEGKNKHFGYYQDFSAACQKADMVRKKYHKDFTPTNLCEDRQ